MALLAAQSSAGALTQMVVTPTTFVFIGERLWLDFVNTDDLRRGVRVDVPVGDAFAGLMIPVVESAAEALVGKELLRVRRCADGRCPRVFYDSTRNGRRRWCDMATCGNRAKAARFRARERDVTPAPTSDISVRPAEARSA